MMTKYQQEILERWRAASPEGKVRIRQEVDRKLRRLRWCLTVSLVCTTLVAVLAVVALVMGWAP